MTAPLERTPWQHAMALHSEGKTPAEIRAALTHAQLDPESVAVLLNALPDSRMPSVMPEAKLDLGVNPLAPRLFSIFELGLSGDPKTIGLYWLVFGGVLSVLLGVFMLLSVMGDDEVSDTWAYGVLVVLPRFGFAVALLSVARGVSLWLGAVRIRRK